LAICVSDLDFSRPVSFYMPLNALLCPAVVLMAHTPVKRLWRASDEVLELCEGCILGEKITKNRK